MGKITGDLQDIPCKYKTKNQLCQTCNIFNNLKFIHKNGYIIIPGICSICNKKICIYQTCCSQHCLDIFEYYFSLNDPKKCYINLKNADIAKKLLNFCIENINDDKKINFINDAIMLLHKLSECCNNDNKDLIKRINSFFEDFEKQIFDIDDDFGINNNDDNKKLSKLFSLSDSSDSPEEQLIIFTKIKEEEEEEEEEEKKSEEEDRRKMDKMRKRSRNLLLKLRKENSDNDDEDIYERRKLENTQEYEERESEILYSPRKVKFEF
jgi:hypothetical protein